MGAKKGRALPFDTSLGFAAIPVAVCKFYVKHPRFTPMTERVYIYLLRRHNEGEGYAWPSWNAIQRETGIGSRATVQKSLDALEYLMLIEREKEGRPNNIYRFRQPIEDAGEFERVFGADLAGEKNERKDGETDRIIDYF